MNPIDTEQISYFARRIQDEQCILMLGPGLALGQEGSSLPEAIRKHLETVLPQEPGFYQEDEFFSFRNPRERFRAYDGIQNFYRQLPRPSLYDQLAQIPFHLILSLSPDLLLPQAFEEAGFSYKSDYYRKYQNPQALALPSPERPVLYNLLGSVEDVDSLVFTYDDLFAYLEAIFSKHRLHESLREALDRCDHFIFLGFDFRKWYMKLLLRLLNLHQNKYIEVYSPPEQDESYRVFYADYFQMEFIEGSPEGFVKALHQHFKNEGKLRSKGEALPAKVLEEVSYLLSQDEIERAIDQLSGLLKDFDREHYRELVQISGRYSGLMSRLRQGLEDEASVNLERNRVRHGLSGLIGEMQKE